jgi:rubrerythrin
MPEFVPIPIIKNHMDLIAAIRLSLAAELEAANLYRGIAGQVEDEKVRAAILEVADDETRHCGSFIQILETLDNEGSKLILQGLAESGEILKGKDIPEKEKPNVE